MKTLKTLSLICLSLLLVNTSSKKHKKPGTVRGRIMVNCTTPLPNHLVKIKTDLGYSGKYVEDVNGNKEFMTDSEGYFEINYISNWGKGSLVVSGYSDVLEEIPIGEGQVLDIGEVYLNGKVNFIVKLQVNNPHTIYDTLVLRDYNGPSIYSKLKIPGPFVSGIIDTVWNESYMSYPIMYNKPIVYNRFGYYFSSDPTNITYSYFNASFCTNELSEAIITID